MRRMLPCWLKRAGRYRPRKLHLFNSVVHLSLTSPELTGDVLQPSSPNLYFRGAQRIDAAPWEAFTLMGFI